MHISGEGEEAGVASARQLVVSRPNLRLCSLPWHEEYKAELGLRSHDRIQLAAMLANSAARKFKGALFGEAEQSLDKGSSNAINRILGKESVLSSFNNSYMDTNSQFTYLNRLGNCSVYFLKYYLVI